MGIFEWLFGTNKKIKAKDGTDVAIVSISPADIYKELAVYTARSLVANAISGCEFKVYENGKAVKNKDWYLLNVAPNKNENASYFWNKIVNKMLGKEGKAYVIEVGGELHVVEGISVTNNALHGNVYENIMLSDGKSIEGKYTEEDIYIFELEHKGADGLISMMWKEYGTIYQAAARAFKDSNARRYKLKVDGIKAGDEEFVNEWNEYIKEQVEVYMMNEYATYVEYDGYELVREETGAPKSADDLMKIKNDMFETVGQALKIPSSLMTGNITSVKDVMMIFLTFGVDPYADAIGKALNRRAGEKAVISGNYYRVNTGKIKHRDPIEDAPNIEKLIGSGFANIDETREEMDYIPKKEWWSEIHWITKNWGKIEDVANAMEGGE